MSMFFRHQVACHHCGQTSDQPMLLSTHAIGQPDLDLRPPESAHSMLEHEIQQCSRRGYCAGNLAEPTVDVSGMVGAAH